MENPNQRKLQHTVGVGKTAKRDIHLEGFVSEKLQVLNPQREGQRG